MFKNKWKNWNQNQLILVNGARRMNEEKSCKFFGIREWRDDVVGT